MSIEKLNIIKTNLRAGKTYKEIGKLLSLTRQRIGQLVNKHFKDLKPIRPAHIKSKTRATKMQDSWNIPEKDLPLLYTQKGKWLRSVISSAKQNSKKKNLEFSLNFLDIYKRLPDTCPIFGIILDYGLKKNGRLPNSPSIDRLDPKSGYTNKNVHIISWKANRIKCDANLEELNQLSEYMNKINQKDLSSDLW